MSEQTIPDPHPDELRTARIGCRNRAIRAGVDIENTCVQELIELNAEVEAQLAAEIRWLRNLLHSPRRVS